MKTAPVEGWTPARTRYPVRIPKTDGTETAEIVEIEVDAWRDADGQIFLDGAAREAIEAVKARHLGLLTPARIGELRAHLGLTQGEISELLQIGARSWSRWENGRERPSRSMNVLLRALDDGRLDINYLRGLREPAREDNAFRRARLAAVAAGNRYERRSAYRRSEGATSASSSPVRPSDETFPA